MLVQPGEQARSDPAKRGRKIEMRKIKFENSA